MRALHGCGEGVLSGSVFTLSSLMGLVPPVHGLNEGVSRGVLAYQSHVELSSQFVLVIRNGEMRLDCRDTAPPVSDIYAAASAVPMFRLVICSPQSNKSPKTVGTVDRQG